MSGFCVLEEFCGRAINPGDCCTLKKQNSDLLTHRFNSLFDSSDSQTSNLAHISLCCAMCIEVKHIKNCSALDVFMWGFTHK